MTWDFADSNPFASSSGSFDKNVDVVSRAIDDGLSANTNGSAKQVAAQSLELSGRFVSTDPPYYDNIGHADLSDYFYVWMRRTLRAVFPALFAGIAVPKAEELVATPYRHGSKDNAETFFLDGMTSAMSRISEQAHPSAPVTIYYAFKQSETSDSAGTSSTGWVTFLDAVLRAGFALTGTWPMRTERGARSIGIGTNAPASSIILVCRRRPADAPTTSRRAFQRELNAVLPVALDAMTLGGDAQAPVAPVDLSQTIIGPGMAVFSRYAAVLEADGSPMSVKTALQLINRFLAGEDFDADTRFCLRWFEQHTWGEGAYGEADVLARAQATSVGRLAHTGVVLSGGGKVRLCKAAELAPPEDLGPKTAVWQALHLMMQALKTKGESGSGQVLAAVRARTEAIRQLAYRLYTLCERRGLAEDARGYNELVTAWTPIETEAAKAPTKAAQLDLI